MVRLSNCIVVVPPRLLNLAAQMSRRGVLSSPVRSFMEPLHVDWIALNEWQGIKTPIDNGSEAI